MAGIFVRESDDARRQPVFEGISGGPAPCRRVSAGRSISRHYAGWRRSAGASAWRFLVQYVRIGQEYFRIGVKFQVELGWKEFLPSSNMATSVASWDCAPTELVEDRRPRRRAGRSTAPYSMTWARSSVRRAGSLTPGFAVVLPAILPSHRSCNPRCERLAINDANGSHLLRRIPFRRFRQHFRRYLHRSQTARFLRSTSH